MILLFDYYYYYYYCLPIGPFKHHMRRVHALLSLVQFVGSYCGRKCVLRCAPALTSCFQLGAVLVCWKANNLRIARSRSVNQKSSSDSVSTHRQEDLRDYGLEMHIPLPNRNAEETFHIRSAWLIRLSLVVKNNKFPFITVKVEPVRLFPWLGR